MGPADEVRYTLVLAICQKSAKPSVMISQTRRVHQVITAHPKCTFAIALLATSLHSCGPTAGSVWARESYHSDNTPSLPDPRHETALFIRDTRSHTIGGATNVESQNPQDPLDLPVVGRSLGVFRNTYYCFPNEAHYSGEQTAVFDAQCVQIALVPQSFHDRVCVQGSGRLLSGQTISYAKRDCSCASECPRSKQRICYEALSQAKYPWGRGAVGKPITPLRTIAVDSSVIPLNSAVFIPAFVSIPLPDGTPHDGCFFAEDRGSKVVGHSIDVFAGGDPELQRLNQLIPTATGVEVWVDHPYCDELLSKRQR